MGRAGDSLENKFPPRSGGGSPLQEKSLVGRIRPMEWFKVIVESYYFFINNYCWARSTAYGVSRVGFVSIFHKRVVLMQGKRWPAQTAFCCCGFRLRILYKSQDASFCVFVIFILVQGFSVKVAMTGVLGDHCSETFFAFSLPDSLEKSRWQGSSTIMARIHVLHSGTGILWKSRDQVLSQRHNWLSSNFENSCSFLRNYTHFRRWVISASRCSLWPP